MWIVLSETGQDDDLLENEPPDDQDVGLQERDHLSEHLEDTFSTLGTPTERKSQIHKEEDALPVLSSNTTAITWLPNASEPLSGHCKDDASDSVAKSEPIESIDVSDQKNVDINGFKNNMGESDPKQDLAESIPEQDMNVRSFKQDKGETDPSQNDTSSDIEILSNPDSAVTIPLDESERDQDISSVSNDCILIDFDSEPKTDAHEEDSKTQIVNEFSADTIPLVIKSEGDPGEGRGSFTRKRKHSSSDRDSSNRSCSSDGSW